MCQDLIGKMCLNKKQGGQLFSFNFDLLQTDMEIEPDK